MWFNATTSGRADEASALADELLAIARELDDADLLLEAYHAKVPMLLRVPDFAGMSEAAREVIRLYDRERHRDHAYYFGGHDARMCARSFYAVSLWGQGLLDQAKSTALQSIEDARALGHLFSVAHALQRGGLYMALMEDVEACRVMTDELYPLAERNKFPWQLADAQFHARLAGRAGRRFRFRHRAMMKRRGHACWRRLRADVRRADRRTGAARGLRRAGLGQDRALDRRYEAKGNRFCAPELFRARGEALRAQARPDDAERDFREALAMSRKQSCRPLELRAATSLARLLATARARRRRATCSRRSTAPSPKASNAPTCRRRRRCWPN